MLCHPSFMPQALSTSVFDHSYICTLCVQGLLCTYIHIVQYWWQVLISVTVLCSRSPTSYPPPVLELGMRLQYKLQFPSKPWKAGLGTTLGTQEWYYWTYLWPPDERCTGLLQHQLNHPPTGEHNDVILSALSRTASSGVQVQFMQDCEIINGRV